MKKKGIIGLSIPTLIIILCLSMTLPAFAHLEPDVNSFWATTTPTINGIMAGGEWTDAATRTFTLYMRSRADGTLMKTLDGKLWVKNNWNTLYFAIQIYNDDYEATDFLNLWNGLAILFEDNHDGALAVGDQGEGVTTWVGSPFFLYNDLYYTGASWSADFYAGKVNDGSLAWSHTNPVQGNIGDWTFEMAIPLAGTDGDAYDFALANLPKTVGFKVWFQEPGKGTDGVYPDDPATPINIQETLNASTFGTLIIHPLYYLTIQTTAGGTTSPVPGVYAYGYGTVVPVTAIPDPGYNLDHWELDTVNVGTANPYSVTMNQNHTLKAFFAKLPGGPVGGVSFSLKQTERAISLPLLACYGAVFAVFGVTARKLRRRKT